MSSDVTWLPPPADGQTFEALCLDVFKEVWHDPDAYLVGRNGQAQRGVDIIGCDGKERVGLQCKKRGGPSKSKVLSKDLEEDIKVARKITPALARFILATTASRDEKLQRRAEELACEHGLKIFVWFWEDITREILNNPKLLSEVIRRYWPDLRKAFAGTTEMNLTLENQVDRLISRRLAAISKGVLGMPLLSREAVVFHLIPLAAFNPSRKSTQDAKTQTISLPLINPRIDRMEFTRDLEGILTVARAREACRAYTKLFQTGLLESVDCESVNEREDSTGVAQNTFSPQDYEQGICNCFPLFLERMRGAGIKPPAFVALSLIGMQGKMPFLGEGARFRVLRAGLHGITSDQLRLEPIPIGSLSIEGSEVLPPLLNGVWQECGKEGSPYLDCDGRFIG